MLRRSPDDMQPISEPPDTNWETAKICAIAEQVQTRVSIADSSESARECNNEMGVLYGCSGGLKGRNRMKELLT